MFSRRYLKDQSGAILVFELIILALVLSAAGFAGYQYMKNSKAVSHTTMPKPHATAKPSPTTKPSPTSSLVPYAGWKTYNEPYEHATYKYPPTWKFSVAYQPLSPGGIQVETDTLISPTGFVLTFSSPLQGIGGACGEDLPDKLTYYSADQLPLANVREPVFMVVKQLVSNGVVDRRIGLEELTNAPGLGTWNSCGVNFDLFLVNSHGKDRLLALFGGGFPNGAQQNSLNIADYEKLPDVVNAELVLKSLTFATPE
jgi:hypothetical protein